MVHFGDRRISDRDPCFITFEAGATHGGAESAKRLVSLAEAELDVQSGDAQERDGGGAPL